MISFQAIEQTVYDDGKYCRGELGGCGTCPYKTDVKHDADGRVLYAVRERGCDAVSDCTAVDKIWAQVQDKIDNLRDVSQLVYDETKHSDEVASELKDYMIEQLIFLKTGEITTEDFWEDIALAITHIRIEKYIAEYNEQLNEREG